jgi:hypothetical protein
VLFTVGLSLVSGISDDIDKDSVVVIFRILDTSVGINSNSVVVVFGTSGLYNGTKLLFSKIILNL